MPRLVPRLNAGLGLLLLAFNARGQVFDVTEYGAVGDGLTSDTKAPVLRPHIYWVDCEHGSDLADGSSATSAFASLKRARDAARESPAGSASTVNIVGGRTCRSWLQQDAQKGATLQNESLRLDARDSHVSWQTVGPPSVLSGGVPVQASEWKPLTTTQRKLFKTTAAAHIVQLDLKGVVADIGRLKGLSYTGGDACIKTQFYEQSGLELVHAPTAGGAAADTAAHKLVMARFPNLVEPPVPSNWLDYRDPDTATLALTLDAAAEQREAWAQQVEGGGQLFTHGLWKFNWADSHRRVLSVSDAGGGGVRLGLQEHGDFTDRDCGLSAASANHQGGHVYVYNAHFELDQAGEYSIDHTTDTLYFWPPTVHDAYGGSFELSVATSLLTVTDAINVSFSGLSFRSARGAGVVVVNSTGVVLADGTLSDTGMSVLNVTGGARCGVRNMTLVRGGTGGAVLNGGDRQTLNKSNHFVLDSTVRDCNRWLMNYAPLARHSSY